MRYMILRTSSKEEGGSGGYEVCPRVFATLDEAEQYRASISPSRSPMTVAIVRPDDGESVWYNEHGVEFLFLYEETSGGERIVWLLDDLGCEVGIPKSGFEKSFRQHKETP